MTGTADLNYSIAIVNPDGTPLAGFITQWNSLRTDVGKALDAAATAVAGSYQPLDPDLTTIAGQTNTPFGLSLLTEASAAHLLGTTLNAYTKTQTDSAITTALGPYLTSATAASTYQLLGSYVRYDAQTLTSPQQAQARSNIGAGTGSGTVTSVGLTSTDLTVSGSPVTGSGSITANLATQAGITAAAYGDASHSLTATVNSKGVLTGLSSQSIAIGWSAITSGKPTTLSGYGITDAQASSTGLTNFVALAWSAGTQVPALTAANTWGLKTVGSAAGNVLDRAAGDALYLAIAGTAADSSKLGGVAAASYLTTTAAAAAYQPLDGDLTSLAAASATGAMYYRSAANTWSTVTIGSGVAFSAGTLSATGSGGTVTSVGLSSTDFTVSGSPVTGAGSITANLNTQAGITAAAYGDASHTVTATVNSKGVLTALASQLIAIGWSQITSGVPTTLAGYGITDAVSSTGSTSYGRGLLTAASATALMNGLSATDLTTGTLPVAQTAALTGAVTKPAGSSVTTYTTVPVASGGTGAITAPLARASLNIDGRTTVGDANYTILPTDILVVASAVLTATRTWTLPAANGVNAGQAVIIDTQNSLTGFNLTIAAAGADTVHGLSSALLSTNRLLVAFVSNGSNQWNYDPHAARGTALNTGAPTSGNSTQNIGAGTRILANPITGNLNVTLSTNVVANTGLSAGDMIEYRRPGADAFTASIKNGAGTVLVGAVVNRTYRFLFNGSDWIYWGSTAD